MNKIDTLVELLSKDLIKIYYKVANSHEKENQDFESAL
jgi:hypothetical protein